MLNISKNWGALALPVSHGGVAWHQRAAEDGANRATYQSLSEEGGEGELGGGVGCSLVNVVVIGVSSIDGRSQEWETQWKFPETEQH